MFHPIPERILSRMKQLERQDEADRLDSTPVSRRLRQIPSETGRFLALLAASAPPGKWVEIGTSAGYSTLWLSLAAMEMGHKVITFDVDPAKVALARETFRLAGVENWVEPVEADARQQLPGLNEISFCFIDLEKELYLDCYELVVPRMVAGGILVADNAISHQEGLATFLERVMQDKRVDALVVPIGKGDLLCRKR
jgi:predicted O-methyltransferase YrrM